MSNITVLNKEVEIIDNKVVINQTTKTVMAKVDLEMQLRDIQVRKSRIKETNQRLADDYNKLVEEETEINNLISQLPTTEDIINPLE